jgi:hypothetical protein
MLPRKKVVRWLGHCFGERYSEARRVYLPVGVIFNMHCGIKFVACIVEIKYKTRRDDGKQ